MENKQTEWIVLSDQNRLVPFPFLGCQKYMNTSAYVTYLSQRIFVPEFSEPYKKRACVPPVYACKAKTRELLRVPLFHRNGNLPLLILKNCMFWNQAVKTVWNAQYSAFDVSVQMQLLVATMHQIQTLKSGQIMCQ